MVEPSATLGELADNEEYDWEGDSNMENSFEPPALMAKRSSILSIVISDKNYKIINQD
jgi:hypothetical protein